MRRRWLDAIRWWLRGGDEEPQGFVYGRIARLRSDADRWIRPLRRLGNR